MRVAATRGRGDLCAARTGAGAGSVIHLPPPRPNC